MSCRRCGLRVRKDDRFVLVGSYPSWWKKSSFSLLCGLEYFGELYHEACYMESSEKQESERLKSRAGNILLRGYGVTDGKMP